MGNIEALNVFRNVLDQIVGMGYCKKVADVLVLHNAFLTLESAVCEVETQDKEIMQPVQESLP